MLLSCLVCCLAARYCLSLERTISSSFPSRLSVTQTLSASAFPCFNASCIFAWPILLGRGMGLLYNFIDSRERRGRRAAGSGIKPTAVAKAFVHGVHTLPGERCGTPITPFLSAFHSSLTLPSLCPFSSH